MHGSLHVNHITFTFFLLIKWYDKVAVYKTNYLASILRIHDINLIRHFGLKFHLFQVLYNEPYWYVIILIMDIVSDFKVLRDTDVKVLKGELKFVDF